MWFLPDFMNTCGPVIILEMPLDHTQNLLICDSLLRSFFKNTVVLKKDLPILDFLMAPGWLLDRNSPILASHCMIDSWLTAQPHRWQQENPTLHAKVLCPMRFLSQPSQFILFIYFCPTYLFLGPAHSMLDCTLCNSIT